MTLHEATQKAFGCCVDMSKPLVKQYFWLTVRFLDNDKADSTQYDPRVILEVIEQKVNSMRATFPNLIK